jgi:hypothetical protein
MRPGGEVPGWTMSAACKATAHVTAAAGMTATGMTSAATGMTAATTGMTAAMLCKCRRYSQDRPQNADRQKKVSALITHGCHLR